MVITTSLDSRLQCGLKDDVQKYKCKPVRVDPTLAIILEKMPVRLRDKCISRFCNPPSQSWTGYTSAARKKDLTQDGILAGTNNWFKRGGVPSMSDSGEKMDGRDSGKLTRKYLSAGGGGEDTASVMKDVIPLV